MDLVEGSIVHGEGHLQGGVRRQYTGTAGRIENAQVSMFLAYASEAGRALIDREVYLPKVWTEDRDRCQAAGVPDDVTFATKLALGRRMLTRALNAGVPTAWVTADEFYGGDRGLRADPRASELQPAVPAARACAADSAPSTTLGSSDQDRKIVPGFILPACVYRPAFGSGPTSWRGSSHGTF